MPSKSWILKRTYMFSCSSLKYLKWPACWLLILLRIQTCLPRESAAVESCLDFVLYWWFGGLVVVWLQVPRVEEPWLRIKCLWDWVWGFIACPWMNIMSIVIVENLLKTNHILCSVLHGLHITREEIWALVYSLIAWHSGGLYIAERVQCPLSHIHKPTSLLLRGLEFLGSGFILVSLVLAFVVKYLIKTLTIHC